MLRCMSVGLQRRPHPFPPNDSLPPPSFLTCNLSTPHIRLVVQPEFTPCNKLGPSITERNAYPEVLKRQGIGHSMEFLENVQKLVLVWLQLQEGVMLGKHLHYHLGPIRVPGTGDLQEPCAAQTRERERESHNSIACSSN